MRPDGSGLRQLTDTRGVVKQPDGTLVGELPGPIVRAGDRVAKLKGHTLSHRPR